MNKERFYNEKLKDIIKYFNSIYGINNYEICGTTALLRGDIDYQMI